MALQITATNYSTIVSLLQARAIEKPDQKIYTFLQDGKAPSTSLNYGELDIKARAIAAYLQSKAIPGARALLLYPPGLEFLSAFFGCLYAGIIAIPAPPLDASRLKRSLPRLQAIAKDAESTLVLTTSGLMSGLEQVYTQIAEFQVMQWIATDAVSLDLAASLQETNLESDSLAYLQYTSGSTSTPKGVMVSHGNIMHQSACINKTVEVTPDSIGISWLPYFHDYGLLAGLIQPLYAGSHSYLMSPVAFIKRPLQWLQNISDYKVTHSGAPNFAYEQCIQKFTPETFAGLDLSSWSVAHSGAEPIRQETLEKFAQTFKPYGFNPSALSPCYGLAEATLMVTTTKPANLPVFPKFEPEALAQNRVVQTFAMGAQPLVGCGGVSMNMQVVIANPQTLTRCANDEVGEIWVNGGSVTLGYWNRPEDTERVFHAYLADTKEGPFLRTGDLGFFKNGELFVTGRLKDLIIIRGQNYYPQDIEWAVQKSHPMLRTDCGAVFGIEVGGVEQLAIAQEVERDFYHNDYNIKLLVGAIRQTIGEQYELPIYVIVLLKRGSIPKTSSGKIQRHAVRESFLAGTLESIATSFLNSVATDPYALPQNTLELELVDIFKKVLNLASVGTQDNFFEIGGESLSYLQMCALIEEKLGKSLPTNIQFHSLTVEYIASLLTQSDELPVVVSQDLPVEENLIRHSPFKSIKYIFLSRELSLSEKIQRSWEVIHNFISKTGPDFDDYVLPYSLGTKFISWYCGQKWAQAIFFPRQVYLVEQCLLSINTPIKKSDVIRQSLTSNFWSDWRLAALTDCTTEEFNHWVNVTGIETLQKSHNKGRGVILLHNHSVFFALSGLILMKLGFDDSMLMGGIPYPLELMRLNHLKRKFMLDRESYKAPQNARFARQLHMAKQTLEKGGILHMAPDGYRENHGKNVSFYGRNRCFRAGFAELAVMTNADVIPVEVSLDVTGKVQVKFLEPLVVVPGDHQQQVDSLFNQYIDIFAETWAKNLGNMQWDELAHFLTLPRL
jgi:acyl-CoA synthetase (AMP-forming)/AMP-acid ligase II/lauroyl/myristoyl acyltransferase/acyl carrier protein